MSDDVPYWLRAEREAREAEVELLKKIIDEERVKFLEENGTLIAQKFQATHERDEARAQCIPVAAWAALVVEVLENATTSEDDAERYARQASKATVPLSEKHGRASDVLADVIQEIQKLPGWTGHEYPTVAVTAALEAEVRCLESRLGAANDEAAQHIATLATKAAELEVERDEARAVVVDALQVGATRASFDVGGDMRRILGAAVQRWGPR